MVDTIRVLAENQRPRERLLGGDAESLTDLELLAILIGSGTRHSDVMDVSRRLLDAFVCFRGIARQSASGLLAVKGIGSGNAARLLAAIEIGKRFREEAIHREGEHIRSAKDAARIFMPRMRDIRAESFRCVFLDARHRIISAREMVRGTPNSANPVIRNIVEEALRVSASALICMHNHPSGNPDPSEDDIRFTSELARSLRSLDMRFLDHLIFGDNRYVSLHARLGREFSGNAV